MSTPGSKLLTGKLMMSAPGKPVNGGFTGLPRRIRSKLAGGSSAVKFRAIVELSGKTATGIRVPAEVVERLGQRRRPPVSVTIGGYTYRSTVGVLGGQLMLPLSAENRAAAGVAVGDEIEVELELDTQSREVSVPADFADALSTDATARQGFSKLSSSHQQRWILSITSAKAEETRQRRIDKAIEALRAK
jgi:hypothetical protein